MRLFKSFRGLLTNKKGNVLMLTAGAMPLLIGSAGLAVDTIQLSLLKRHLQRAADSGALAGAYARVQSKPVADAVNRALAFNNAFPLSSSTIQNAPTTGPYANNDRAVRVMLTARRSLPFWSFFSSSVPVINVEATASLVYTGKYCMVSLDESAGTGITFSGHSTVNLGCGVISNTSGAAAVYADGSATVTASPVAAVGGVPTSSVYRQPTLLLPYSLKQEDPFKDIPDPSPPLPCNAGITDSSAAPVPGQCYRGFDINKAMSLTAGTYYITGPLTLNANANLVAHNVTLVLTSETPSVPTSFPSVNIDGNARLDLTAPTSGTYEGIVMHYDGRAPTTSPGPIINGNSNSKFEGAFYFPTQNLTFNGNSDMVTNCIQLVAFHLTFEGNTEINNNCPTGGGAKSFDVKWVRLVA
jgi:Flp pilus assembly protein TadG